MGVVAALDAEARMLGRAAVRQDGLSDLREGSLLAVSGMGADCAAAASRRLIDAGAQALMSFGYAGGLDPTLEPGAIVIPDEIVVPRADPLRTSAEWRQRLQASFAARRAVSRGKLLCAAAPVDTVAAKAAAFCESGAVAVDMESRAVAQAALVAHIPFVALRVIVDTARDRLPPPVVAASRGGRLHMAVLLRGLALAPWELPALLRLAHRYRAASRSLALAAAVGLQ